MPKKEYRSSLRSQTLIQQAVISLIKEKKDFYSITVSDVCRVADINRGTFYHHYANIAEVANAIEAEMMAEITNAWNQSKATNGSIANFIRTASAKLKENESACKSLTAYVPNHFFETMKEKFILEIEPDFRVNGTLSNYAHATIVVLSSGIVSLYLDYFKGKSAMSLDEIQECCIRIVDNVLTYRSVQ
jgi:AcrR family transcriptional regulator